MNKSVIIIGAGFAGLSAAAFMAKAGYRVTVVEKNATAGGRAAHVLQFQFDKLPVDLCVGACERCRVFRAGTFRIALRMQCIAADLARLGAESARRQRLEQLEGIVMLAFLDQDPREPQRCDAGELLVL